MKCFATYRNLRQAHDARNVCGLHWNLWMSWKRLKSNYDGPRTRQTPSCLLRKCLKASTMPRNHDEIFQLAGLLLKKYGLSCSKIDTKFFVPRIATKPFPWSPEDIRCPKSLQVDNSGIFFLILQQSFPQISRSHQSVNIGIMLSLNLFSKTFKLTTFLLFFKYPRTNR